MKKTKIKQHISLTMQLKEVNLKSYKLKKKKNLQDTETGSSKQTKQDSPK